MKTFYMRRACFFLFLLFLIESISAGSISLSPYFQSNMVLQQGKPITIWGTASVGEKIRAVFDGETVFCTADNKGEWSLTFKARKASFNPKQLQVGDTVLHNILIGEVWICSGQSNMAMKTSACDKETYDIKKGEYAISACLLIQEFVLLRTKGYTEKELLRCNVNDYFRYTWEVASNDRFQDFSAVATHFGIQLHVKSRSPPGIDLLCGRRFSNKQLDTGRYLEASSGYSFFI